MRSTAITAISPGRFWSAVLTAGIVLRLAAVMLFADLEQPPLYEYGGIARHMVAGLGYSILFPSLNQDIGYTTDIEEDAQPTAFTLPGLTLIIAGVFSVFGDNQTAYAILFLLNILAAMTAVRLIARAAEELYGLSIGRWTAVLAAVYPTIVITAATSGGTPWYHLLMALTLLLVIRAIRERGELRLVIFAGVAAGLWVLFRSEGLAAAGILGLWIWRRSTFRRAALFGVTTMLVFLPWSVRNTIVFDRFIPFSTNVWLNAWRGNHDGATGGTFSQDGRPNWTDPEMFARIASLPLTRDHELRVMDIYREETLAFVSAHPGQAVALYFKKLLMFFTIDSSDPRTQSPLFFIPHLLLSAGALAGVILLLRRREVVWPLLAIILSNALIVAFLHVETRYQLILSILYVVFLAVTADALFGRIRARSVPHRFPAPEKQST